MCFPREVPGAAVPELARRLDAGGVDDLWLIEDCFFSTAPPLAAAALASTERLTVALGILPAVARTAAVTAMEIATLAGIGPGRVVGGIGHGVQSWMGQMGVRPASPLAALEEVLTAVRRLLAGETLTVAGRYVTLEDVSLALPPDPVPPVLAGVRGPKSVALAGRVADGVVLGGPSTPDYVTWTRATAVAGPDFQVACFAPMSVAADARTAYEGIAPLLVEIVGTDDGTGLRHLPFYDEMLALARSRGAEGLVGMPRDWWVRIGPIGTPDDAAEHVALVEAAGATSVAFFPSSDMEVLRRQVDVVVDLASR